ncbi:MAG: cadherin repeat domain-containing protein, partial [Planctomycetes bacterium]|nr:cadherin repeat domain-containing protein [Planctomycetota bacterium]
SSATVNVAENQTSVTTVTATDADGDTPTFTITGGADAAHFNINASGVLTLTSGKNFEAFTDNNSDGVYEVEVTANDGNTGTDVQTILVTVTDENEAPTLITLSASSVDDTTDSSGGYTIGSMTTTDQDAADTTSYTINGGADAGVFSLSGSDLILTDGILDFETQSSYEVIVRITDSGGLTHDQTFIITVNDQNDAPIINSSATVNVAENQTSVTTVTATDADGDTPTFTITGGADAAHFNINASGV